MSAQPHHGHAATGTSAVVEQALRREANALIRGVDDDLGVAEPETTDVLCECVHPDLRAEVGA